MGRKRLLTILAGVVAAVGLHMAPAAALDVDVDLKVVEVEAKVSEDGVEAKVGEKKDADDEDEDADEKEVSAKVSSDGVEAKVGDKEVSTSDKTSDEPTGGGDSDPGDSGRSGDGGSTSDRSGGDDGVRTAGEGQHVGGADRPERLDPEQARRFLAASEGSGSMQGSGGEVTPAFDLSRDGDLDSPLVAAPAEPADQHDWEHAAPEVDEPNRSDAELAAIPHTGGSGDEVPLGLKLVAALLVAGTGTVWHLARRELQPVKAPHTA